MENQLQKIIEKLSPLEVKIMPFLNISNIEEIKKQSGLDETSVLRALKFLENKNILKIKKTAKTIIGLGTNGIYYKKNNLPERNLLLILEQNSPISLEEAKKLSKFSENEFKVSLGVLKNKALIELKNGKLFLTAKKDEISKKTLEEKFLEILPIEKDKLQPEQLLALENLKKRKDIIEIKEKSTIEFELLSLGEQLAGKEIKLDLIEEITPKVIKNWKNSKKFRSYDIQSQVPQLHGGKKHFVNQSIEYAKRVWLDLGFKEMTGTKAVSSFWNFDALFTAQDHPVREMQDTFFIKNIEATLPSKELVETSRFLSRKSNLDGAQERTHNQSVLDKVKKSHESGIGGSKGWQYLWNEKAAKRVLLRTHTTCLSAKTLAKLKPSDLPAKYFAIGKVFRNETLDWKHGFEFNQTEGIVIDQNGNLCNLIGYLAEFAKKMGFEKVKFQPSFFPYTEPSIEGLVWHKEKKEWIEVFAAGIFRPEVTIPLLGTKIPVLAWGPGFDRLMMMAYEISDMRELYSNNLKQLRNIPVWSK